MCYPTEPPTTQSHFFAPEMGGHADWLRALVRVRLGSHDRPFWLVN